MDSVKEAKLNEAKEKLPISFLTDFVSRGWDDIGYLKETIKSISENFSGTKKVEELLQALVDAYLVCIGQLELHLQDKDYLDADLKEGLNESVDIHIEDGAVSVTNDAGEQVAEVLIDQAQQTDGNENEIPPAEANMPIVTEPANDPIAADDGEFNTPFEFDAPEAEGVRKFEKPEVADFFVDFDEPVGEPVTEKELYGEGEEQIDAEKISDDADEK